MLDARTADIVQNAPVYLEIGCRAHAFGGERAGRRYGIDHLAEDDGVFWRKAVHQHPCGGGNALAGRHIVARHHRVTDKARARPAGVIGRQQTAGRVLQHFAGQRVDRLNEPARACRLLEQVQHRADPQDETARGSEINLRVEAGAAIRHVDGDVANLDIAEPEAARIKIGIERGDDLDFIGIAR